MFGKIFEKFKRLFKKEESPKEQVEIIDVLFYAKHLYLFCIRNNPEEFPGMCFCIHKALTAYTNTCVSYTDIIHYIPEFNAEFLNGDPSQVYWWPINNTKSRIKAFDKLIKVYE